MQHDNVCTFALLRIGENQSKSDAGWLRRTFGKVAPKPPQDLDSRIESAAGVVIQMILGDACTNIGKSTLDAKFDRLPKGLHITVMFGMCLVMGIAFLLREEGHTVDQQKVALHTVGALLLIRSAEEKLEQYELAHILLMKFAKAGGKFTEWQNNLTKLVSMYLLASNDKRLQKHDYPALFGCMLKTLISAVELPV